MLGIALYHNPRRLGPSCWLTVHVVGMQSELAAEVGHPLLSRCVGRLELLYARRPAHLQVSRLAAPKR